MSPNTELIASTAVTADAAAAVVGGGTGTEEVVTQEEREEVLEEIDDEVVILEEDIRLIHRDISSASVKLKSYIAHLVKCPPMS